MKKIVIIISMLCCVFAVQAQEKEGFKKGVHDYAFADGRIYSGEWSDYKPSGKGKMSYSDGSSYEGNFVLGQPSGVGIKYYSNGDTYNGNWSNGKRTGTGVLTKANGTKFSGNWMNDNLNGIATVTFADGDVYNGTVTDIKVTGQGELKTKDGEVYKGTFEDGQPIKFTVTDEKGNTHEVERKDGHEYARSKTKVEISEGVSGYLEMSTVDKELDKDVIFTMDNGTRITFSKNGLDNLIGDGKWVDEEFVYEGHFEHLKFEGEGTQIYNDGGKYVGHFKNGESDGQGTMTWADGRKYVGQWKEDRINGQGTMTQAHGGKAIGEWKDGNLWNGNYTNYRTDDEREFTVKVVNGKRTGQGTLYFYSGDYEGGKYVGMFNNGEYNGQGTYTWADGDKYVGQWSNDKKNGQGTLYFADGRKYTGGWVNDQKSGQGTFTWPDGDKYVGQWSNDKRNGQGTYYYANGNKYVGQWSNSKRWGQGTMTYGLSGRPWIKSTGVFRDKHMVSGTMVRTDGTWVGTWNEDTGRAISTRKVR